MIRSTFCIYYRPQYFSERFSGPPNVQSDFLIDYERSQECKNSYMYNDTYVFSFSFGDYILSYYSRLSPKITLNHFF